MSFCGLLDLQRWIGVGIDSHGVPSKASGCLNVGARVIKEQNLVCIDS